MKIINIASSDNFEDILEAVKETSSDKVVLVVPRSNRVFKSKTKAGQLKSEFERLGKEVSIVSSGKRTRKTLTQEKRETTQEFKKMNRGRENDIASFYSGVSKSREKLKRSFDFVRKNISGRDDLKKFVFFFLGTALVVFIIIVFTALGEARIRISPAKKNFSVSIPLTVSENIARVDEIYGMIPGKFVQLEKAASKDFTATGEKEVFQKARGKITIYNNFSALSQLLVATTRFQNPEGLVFRITERVTVPGMSKVGGETRPGEIEVEVAADRAGEDYNIGPSDFKIPGFLGSSKYQGFYAKSFARFSGGFIGNSSYITKEDIEQAENSAKEEAQKAIKSELASLAGFKTLDEALDIKTEILPESNKSGDLVKNFKVVAKAGLKTVVFKESDAADFISRYIKNSQGLEVVKSSLKMMYNDARFDVEKKELSVKLDSSGNMVENTDKDAIIKSVAGKNEKEVRSYLRELNGVESYQIFLSPFWIRSIPKNLDRVKVEVVTQ